MIITIIVLIVLTGTVIMTMNKGEIIDNANKATNLSNLDTLKSAYMMERANNMLENKQDDIGALEKAAKSCQMESEFEFEDGTVKYVGKNINAKAWVIESFILEEYICSGVKGKVYISGLNTTDKMLVSTITSKGYLVYSNAGTPVTTGNLKTGYVVKTTDGDIIGTIVYFGDVNGDGVIEIGDAFQVSRMIANQSVGVDQIFKDLPYSADVNHDGIIDNTDATTIQSFDLHTSTIDQGAKVIELSNIE